MADTAASILDSFVVSIGLDSSGVEAGRKKAMAEIKKLRDDAVAGANDAERRNNRVADSIGSIRNEVVGLSLAFAGSAGIKDFVGSILGNDAAVGRFAANIGASTEAVGAWQYALGSVQGSAQDAMGSLQAMQNVMEAHRMGQNSPADTALRMLGLRNGEDKDPLNMLRILSENRNNLNRGDQVSLLQQAGIDQNSINVIVQGVAAFDKLIAAGKEHYRITKADADAAIAFYAALNDLTAQIQTEARPAISAMAGGFATLSQNADGVKTVAEGAVAVIGAVAIAAGVAYAPVVALATVIFGLAKAYEELSTAEGRSRIARNLSEDGKFLSDIYTAMHGDPAGMGARVSAVLQNDHFSTGPVGGPSNIGSGGVGGQSGATMASAPIENIVAALTQRGVNPGTALGIASGMKAEGGGIGYSPNGAFGIGQWRGDRLKRLFAKYGHAPSLHQQWDFLYSELSGGDPGGKSVLASTDPDAALLNYVYKFMRPQGAHGEHMQDALADVARGRRAMYGGARVAAGRHSSHHGSSSKTEVNINNMNVHGARDAAETAKKLPKEIAKRAMILQAPSGQSG